LFYHISALTTDKAKSQIASLSLDANGKFQDDFANFCRSKDQLDNFYFRLIGSSSEYAELFSVIRSVLILSHGNADVESGFSVNSDFLVENLQEDSLITQRTVYDALTASYTVCCNMYVGQMLATRKRLNARKRKRQKKHKELQKKARKERH